MPHLNRLLAALLLYAWVAQPALALDLSLPDMGDSSAAHLGGHLESKLGRAFMRYIRASSDVIDDPLVNSYLQSVGDKLARHSDTRGRKLTFFAIDDPSINAFAGPDGYIGIHSGLMLEAETESELAAVLAHEIGHVAGKHGLRAIKKSRWTSVGTILATESARTFGSEELAQLTEELEGSIHDITQTLVNNGYSKDLEREADEAAA